MSITLGMDVPGQVMVYATIAPMRSSGYYANEWDVNKWDWSGRMRIVAHGYRGCTLILEDDNETFVKAPAFLISPFYVKRGVCACV